MDPRSERARAVERALQAAAPDLVTTSLGGWRFVVSNGAKVGVDARLVDKWLELTTRLDEAKTRPSHAWPMLQFNARLDGPSRLALAPGADTAHLRAELCLEDEGDLGDRVAALCQEIGRASHALDHGSQATGSPPLDAMAPPIATGLDALCLEAGWPAVERAAGELDVRLDAAGAAYVARLGTTTDRALRAVVDLADAAAFSPASRAATAWLLLGVSAVVRSVKGLAVWPREGIEIVGLGAACARPLSAAGVDEALSSLAVACRLVGREVQALSNDTLAREYLAWRARPVEPSLVEPSTEHAERVSSTAGTNWRKRCLQQPPWKPGSR